jgi:hypothetical protein
MGRIKHKFFSVFAHTKAQAIPAKSSGITGRFIT